MIYVRHQLQFTPPNIFNLELLMKFGIRGLAAAGFLAPMILGAQLKPTISTTTSINLSALKPVVSTDLVAAAGTTLATVPAYFGNTCPTGGCTTVRTSSGSTAAVSLKLSGDKPASSVGATLLAPHGIDHDLGVTINGMQILDAICNNMMELILTPNFKSFGSSTSAFTWQFYDGGKLVSSGKSAGEALKLNVGGQVSQANMYTFDVSSHGVITIDHGAQKIIMTPQDMTGIGAKTGGYLKFEDLGLRMAGLDQFALVSAGAR